MLLEERLSIVSILHFMLRDSRMILQKAGIEQLKLNSCWLGDTCVWFFMHIFHPYSLQIPIFFNITFTILKLLFFFNCLLKNAPMLGPKIFWNLRLHAVSGEILKIVQESTKKRKNDLLNFARLIRLGRFFSAEKNKHEKNKFEAHVVPIFILYFFTFLDVFFKHKDTFSERKNFSSWKSEHFDLKSST